MSSCYSKKLGGDHFITYRLNWRNFSLFSMSLLSKNFDNVHTSLLHEFTNNIFPISDSASP